LASERAWKKENNNNIERSQSAECRVGTAHCTLHFARPRAATRTQSAKSMVINFCVMLRRNVTVFLKRTRLVHTARSLRTGPALSLRARWRINFPLRDLFPIPRKCKSASLELKQLSAPSEKLSSCRPARWVALQGKIPHLKRAPNRTIDTRWAWPAERVGAACGISQKEDCVRWTSILETVELHSNLVGPATTSTSASLSPAHHGELANFEPAAWEQLRRQFVGPTLLRPQKERRPR